MCAFVRMSVCLRVCVCMCVLVSLCFCVMVCVCVCVCVQRHPGKNRISLQDFNCTKHLRISYEI